MRLPSENVQQLPSMSLAWLLLAAAAFTSSTAARAGDLHAVVTVLGTRPLPNAVVYIDEIPGRSFSPPVEPATLDQVHLKFVPHVLPIIAGAVVEFPNSDDTRHSVFSPSATKKFDLGTYPAGTTKRVLFDQPGIAVVLCNVHPDMSAYVVVLKNPYYALTGQDGSCNIPAIPVGRYTVGAWHETLGTKKQPITVAAQGQTFVTFNWTE